MAAGGGATAVSGRTTARDARTPDGAGRGPAPVGARFAAGAADWIGVGGGGAAAGLGAARRAAGRASGFGAGVTASSAGFGDRRGARARASASAEGAGTGSLGLAGVGLRGTWAGEAA
jgi:hypothetical protein